MDTNMSQGQIKIQGFFYTSNCMEKPYGKSNKIGPKWVVEWVFYFRKLNRQRKRHN